MKNYNKLKNVTIQNAIVHLFLVIIVLMSQVASLKGINFLEYAAFIILILIFIRVSKVELFYIVMFLLPSNQYINVEGISIITIVVSLYFAKAILIDKESIYSPLLLLGIILIIYSLLLCGFGSAILALKNFLFLFFCVSILSDTRYDIKEMYMRSIKYLALGLILSSSISLLINPNALVYRFSLTSEQSTNTLGILSSYAVGNILILYQSKISQFTKGWAFTIIPLLIIGIMTQSRSFIFSIAIALLWVVLYSISNLHKKESYRIIFLIIIISVIFALVISINEQISEVLNKAIERIVNPRENDITGGRQSLWDLYIQEFTNNPKILLMGSGKGVSDNILVAPHNIWIQQVYMYGLFGNIIVSTMFLLSVRRIIRKSGLNKISFYGFLPIVMFLAAATYSHVFIGAAETIRFIISILAIWIFAENTCKNHIKTVNGKFPVTYRR